MIDHDLARRAVLKSLIAAAAAGFARPALVRATEAKPGMQAHADALAALEKRHGGRLGVFALDVATNDSFGWRDGERFGLCSTFKLPLCAVVLREAEAGRVSLDERLAYTKEDLVMNSPVTEKNVARGGMTVAALAEATQTTSDNTAANLLIAKLGGPARVTLLVRTLGDPETRIDRFEPMMNRVPPGEVRDTTTPRAMAETLARLFTSDLLAPASRERLRGWMVATGTGKRRLRAGFPSGWTAGDKTGTAYTKEMPNKTNDVAIAWLPGRDEPIVVAAYLEADGFYDLVRPEDEAALAEVGRIVAAAFAPA
ncbi:MAG TPA: class A beta-lactamase [Xanthomonadales bacterium]|nr:class A beta-lactamase [Xanthomonadales bacterium]